ncbi:MAG: hypothetical protein JSR77_17415 [Planctomycetes bacterium]|nr:hypothetical protein [Planctomycetota bacterium]
MRTSASILAATCALAALGSAAFGQADVRSAPFAPHNLGLPAGTAKIIGTMGFLDYANPIRPSDAAQPPLVSFIGDQSEPAEALLPYQSEGRRVEINWPLLASLDSPGEHRATLTLFGGEERELVFVYSEYRTPTSYSWFGQIAGVPASDFILVRADDAVYMILRDYDRKEEFEIHYTPGYGTTAAGHALRAISRVPSDHNRCGTCDGQIGDAPPEAAPTDQLPGGYGARAVSDPTNQIDVLFVATADAISGFGTYSAFYAQAQACVDDFNLTSANAGAGLSMRLMQSDPTAAAGYAESSDGSTDLNRLTSSSDGYMDNVVTLRDAVRADEVCLFRQNRWNVSGGSSTVGVGWRPTSIAGMNSGNGFVVVSRLAGSVPGTFSHEIGHNLGACHHESQNDCATAVTGSAHGFRHACDRLFCYDYWHTTMAYSQSSSACSADTRLTIFSNPNIYFRAPLGCDDFAVGDSVSNVANVIQTTRSVASQWKIAASQAWTYAPNTTGGAGTRYWPYGRISTAVSVVQGGAAQAVVKALAGTYSETALAGRSVVMTNPCVITVAEGGTAVIR